MRHYRKAVIYSALMLLVFTIQSVGQAHPQSSYSIETGTSADLKNANRVFIFANDTQLESEIKNVISSLQLETVGTFDDADVILMITSRLPSTAPDFGVPKEYRLPQPAQGESAITAAILRKTSDTHSKLVYEKQYSEMDARLAARELAARFVEFYGEANAVQ